MDKPLSLGVGVEASEIWRPRSVPEIGGGQMEQDRNHHFSIWSQKFYHQKRFIERREKLFSLLLTCELPHIVHSFNQNAELQRPPLKLVPSVCTYSALVHLGITDSFRGDFTDAIINLVSLTSFLSRMCIKKED